MSYLDYIIIGIIIISGIIAYKRGLIKTIYSFFSLAIGIGLAYILYPRISAFLMKYTGIYSALVNKIIKSLNLEELAQNKITPNDQLEMMDQLQVPQFMKLVLKENKNPEAYNLLKATKLEEYIGGTIATIAINAITFLLVLILSMLLLKIIANVLDLVSKLPVLHQLNKVGGLAIGLTQGVVLAWIFCLVLSIIVSTQSNEKLLTLVNQSPVVNFFSKNNILVIFISNITKILLTIVGS